MLIDGRHRLKACLALRVLCHVRVILEREMTMVNDELVGSFARLDLDLKAA